MTAAVGTDDAIADHPDAWHLRLYVAGPSSTALDAFANLRNLCEEHLAGRYTIEIIDLLEQPSLARQDDVLAIPTLVRHRPPPSLRVIGDLSNTQRVLDRLQLQSESSR
ncbi:MAG TPA: circadian clock KaiB family protein [Micromonosporaceae bacterium]|nr:circadian clock KaiB family protein [Micromonosporaceae bacterium]